VAEQVAEVNQCEDQRANREVTEVNKWLTKILY